MRGVSLSIGAMRNQAEGARVGLRTRRGIKGATVRNRLKRQVRGILARHAAVVPPGMDLVIVIHPKVTPTVTQQLEAELLSLCKKI